MAVLAERPSRVPFVSPFGTHPKHSLRNGVLWVMVGAVPVYPQLEPPRAAPGAEKRSRGAKEKRRKGAEQQRSPCLCWQGGAALLGCSAAHTSAVTAAASSQLCSIPIAPELLQDGHLRCHHHLLRTEIIE